MFYTANVIIFYKYYMSYKFLPWRITLVKLLLWLLGNWRLSVRAMRSRSKAPVIYSMSLKSLCTWQFLWGTNLTFIWITYIILSFDNAWFVDVYVDIDCMRCLATKNAKIPQIFKYTRIVLSWKQNCAFKSRNLICLIVGLCIQYC